jgi:mitochondrial distribution and morphology protein 10
MGAEWWVRRPKGSAGPVVADVGETTLDDTQGVLKGRISTNYVSLCVVDIVARHSGPGNLQDVSLFWEGRLSNVLLGIGVVSDLGNRSRPVRALGLEVAYFS